MMAAILDLLRQTHIYMASLVVKVIYTIIDYPVWCQDWLGFPMWCQICGASIFTLLNTNVPSIVVPSMWCPNVWCHLDWLGFLGLAWIGLDWLLAGISPKIWGIPRGLMTSQMLRIWSKVKVPPG